MSVVILNHDDVNRLMPMTDCVDLMAETLASLARGEAVLPLRTLMWLPDRTGVLGQMPAYLGGKGVMGIKVLSVFPGNWGTEFESHQGAILMFETKNGCLEAIVDASSVTAIRTAAASGAATRALARADAARLAILGTGVQAERHLEAMLAVRTVTAVRVWSRDPEHCRRFADAASRRHGIPVTAAADARRAVENADIICTTTASREPVLEGEWIADGAHVNAVGACTPATRELSTTAIVRSSLFTDRMESLLKEAGDFLIPLGEGAVKEDHVRGEVGQVLADQIAGRRSGAEITVFKSLGIAVEDVACAHFLRGRALETGGGMRLEMGGRRNG